MNWYYKQSDRELGPVSAATLHELAVCGVIANETLVRRDDSADWIFYGEASGGGTIGGEPVNPTDSSVRFDCPGCGQKISAGKEDAGKQAACPSCGTDIVVPGGENTSHTNSPALSRQRVPSAPIPSKQRKSKAIAYSSVAGVAAAILIGIIVVRQWRFSGGQKYEKSPKSQQSTQTSETAAPAPAPAPAPVPAPAPATNTSQKQSVAKVKPVQPAPQSTNQPKPDRVAKAPNKPPRSESPKKAAVPERTTVKGLWIGMPEADAKRQINKIFNNKVEWEKGELYEGHLQSFVYSVNDLLNLDKWTPYCNIEIDIKTKTLAAFSVSGAHLDHMFDSSGLTFDEFAKQFMGHFGIAEIKSDEAAIDLSNPKKVYYHTAGTTKMNFVKRLNDSKYKSFSIFRASKASF